MSRETLISLAAQCEATPQADRELDAMNRAEIERRDVRWEGNQALGRSRTAPHDTCLVGSIDPGRSRRNFTIGYSAPPCPFYTSSLDAATALVPGGWCMDCGTGGGSYVYGPWARVYPDRIAGQNDGTGNCNASTTPLAICAAALRARALPLFGDKGETK